MVTKNNLLKSFPLIAALIVVSPTQGLYAQSSTTAKRCEATTKKGTRCKNTAVNKTKYCQVHQAKSPNVQHARLRLKVAQGAQERLRHLDIASSIIRCILRGNYNISSRRGGHKLIWMIFGNS